MIYFVILNGVFCNLKFMIFSRNANIAIKHKSLAWKWREWERIFQAITEWNERLERVRDDEPYD